MKKVTIEIDDAYATLLTFTVVGVMADATNVHCWSTKIKDGMVIRHVETGKINKYGAVGMAFEEVEV